MTSAAPAGRVPTIPVTPWRGLEGHDRLEAWRANVGPPVSLDAARPGGVPAADRVAVLNWNLWIGRGQLPDVIAEARRRSRAPLIVLLQEAFRSGDTVPARPAGRAARRATGGFPPRAHPRADIVETAERLGLNLRYVASMRNGTYLSDRGNAILSDLPIADARAFELPLVLQRRVALVATIRLASGPLQVVSAHLDPRGPPGGEWLGGAGRARQTSYLLEHLPPGPLVLGADLNLSRGRRERSWRLLVEAGFTTGVPPAHPRWRHTFHALPRLVLDYLLVRDADARLAQVQVERLDEHPQDRGATVFGSDHHPLLAELALRTPGTPG
jgi:endonuclease/exonuclease/phosphatase family metal-dependent hydrolase